jgi:hypothetical protein
MKTIRSLNWVLELLHQESDSVANRGQTERFQFSTNRNWWMFHGSTASKGTFQGFRPNWFLLVDPKGKRPRHRLIPMNGPVRAELQKVIDNRTTGNVFDYKQTGVSVSTLRRGFEIHHDGRTRAD